MFIVFLRHSYTVVKLLEFVRPTFDALQGKEGMTTSYGYMFYLVMQATVAYLGTIFFPGGVFCLWPQLDLFASIFTYGYIILKLPRDEAFHPSSAYRKFVYTLRYATFMALFAQGAYFSRIQNCGWTFLVNVQTVYNFVLVAALTHKFFKWITSPSPVDDGTKLD